jgi:hypothetical protein
MEGYKKVDSNVAVFQTMEEAELHIDFHNKNKEQLEDWIIVLDNGTLYSKEVE